MLSLEAVAAETFELSLGPETLVSQVTPQTGGRRQTEATFPCTNGCPPANPLRRDEVAPISTGRNLSDGLSRVLTTLYGTCGAGEPLNHITFNQRAHNKYELVQSASDVEFGTVHVPGFYEEDRYLRKIKTSADPLGVYSSVGNQAPNACLRSPYRQVHKAFGMGAAGTMVNGRFQVPTCEGMAGAGKARLCGLHPESAPGVTLDCAELIGATSVAACLKLHKNQSISNSGIMLGRSLLSTRALHGQARDSNSCLSAAERISADAPVTKGDIVVIQGHSVVISEVGSDPFGIQRANGNCGGINAGSLNFSFGQSTSRQSTGPINSTTRAWVDVYNRYGFGSEYFPLNKFVQAARKMCEDMKRGSNSWRAEQVFSGFNMTMLRHKSQDPACHFGADCPRLTGDECADACG